VSSGAGASNEDPLTSLHDKLKELTTAHDIVVKNHNQLTKTIGEREERGSSGKTTEQLALFKLTAAGMGKGLLVLIVVHCILISLHCCWWCEGLYCVDNSLCTHYIVCRSGIVAYWLA